MIGQILLQLILIALNAIFACAEIAVISSNETRIDKLAEQGNKPAKRLQALQNRPAQFLATIQVAITLSGFLGSAFAADHFSEALVQLLVSWGIAIPQTTLQTISVVLITILLSFLTLVFGELVPKRIAMRKAEPIALGISGMIQVLAKLCTPLVWLLTAATNGVLRLFRIDPNAEEEEISEEDIRMMADAGSEKGVIAAEENEMIQNVFAFNDWTAEEIMTHRTELQLLWERDSLDSWKQTIRQTPHRYYPICGEHTDDILGVLDTRKLFAVAEQTKECVMKTAVVPAFFIPSTAKANDVFHSMRKAGQSYAIVLDEFGGTDGVLTMLDLMERLVRWTRQQMPLNCRRKTAFIALLVTANWNEWKKRFGCSYRKPMPLLPADGLWNSLDGFRILGKRCCCTVINSKSKRQTLEKCCCSPQHRTQNLLPRLPFKESTC